MGYSLLKFEARKLIETELVSVKNVYLESHMSLTSKNYFVYSGQLQYKYKITNNSSSSGNWLIFDESTGIISGTPVENNIGKYEMEITATDEFGESKTIILVVNVDYTDLQKLTKIFYLILEILSAIIAVVGFYQYRVAIINYLYKSKYSLIPTEIRSSDTVVRHLWVLRSDEEEMARQLDQELSKRGSSLEDLSKLEFVIKSISNLRPKKKFLSLIHI